MDCSYRAAIREELLAETSFSRFQLLRDTCPDIALFRNIRTLSHDEWDLFNTATAELEGECNCDDDIDEDPMIKKQKYMLPVRTTTLLVTMSHQHITLSS
jgi:hypothetical protein